MENSPSEIPLQNLMFDEYNLALRSMSLTAKKKKNRRLRNERKLKILFLEVLRLNSCKRTRTFNCRNFHLNS